MNNEWLKEKMINDRRIKKNKEFIVGGAELSDDNQIIATSEQVEESHELMDTILEARGKISEIREDLESYPENKEIDLSILELKFMELWKFLDNENESNDKVNEDISVIRDLLLKYKDEGKY